jgi:hypothetical protein
MSEAVAAMPAEALASADFAEPKADRCLVEMSSSVQLAIANVHLDGPCSIAIAKDGSIAVGPPGKTDDKALAFVTSHSNAAVWGDDANSNTGTAFLNARYFDGNATWIGEVTRDGDCWTNIRGKVCAWVAQ